jgi:hypothetical protein
MTEPKPCPFCGNKHVAVYNWPGDLFFCLCLNQDCGNEGPKATTRSGAIAKWNKRPEEERLLLLVGQAVDCVDLAVKRAAG